MDFLPFRIEEAGGLTYLVDDGGEHHKPITACISRVADTHTIILWDELKKRVEPEVVRPFEEPAKGKKKQPA